MIVTVTWNPSLDYHMEVPAFEVGKTNRAKSETIRPGGKGINVSVILDRLGVENRCLMVTAGTIGKTLEAMALEEVNNPQFVRLDHDMTRINVKLDGGTETEINGAGPELMEDDIKEMINAMEQCGEDDILVLAGSLPKGVRSDFYADIVRRMNMRGVKTVVDASGEAFRLAVEEGPFLVKPNLAELEEYFEEKISLEEAASYAAKLQEKTGGHVLLSMGKDGAILATPEGCWRETVLKGQVVSATGSGDSMVAGYLYARKRFQTETERLRFAAACGTASAFSPWLADEKKIWGAYRVMEWRNYKMLEVHKTTLSDIPGAMRVIDQAKACMKAYGSPQWQDGYPNAELLAEDVARDEAYVLKEGDEVVGTAMITFREEPTYRVIYDGAWKYDEPYVVIHRIAVDSEKKGKGYAKEILLYAEAMAKAKGVTKVRIDTHEMNQSMQRFLAKNGFEYAGIIYVSETGDEPGTNERDRRIAFEKNLEV